MAAAGGHRIICPGVLQVDAIVDVPRRQWLNVGIVVVTVTHLGSRSTSSSLFAQVGAIIVVVSVPLRAVGGVVVAIDSGVGVAIIRCCRCRHR